MIGLVKFDHTIAGCLGKREIILWVKAFENYRTRVYDVVEKGVRVNAFDDRFGRVSCPLYFTEPSDNFIEYQLASPIQWLLK